MPAQILLAAQPIYGREGDMEAVELLYRNEQGDSALIVGEQRATTELLYNLCTGITDHVEHYGTRAFINVSADLLLSGLVLPVDPDLVMIELVERIEPTPELEAAVVHWREQGFSFALDDFTFDPAWQPLLAHASVIKVDISQYSVEQIAEYKRQLDHLPLRWLAERVEDEAARDQFLAMGFELFQGYYMARPRLISGRRLAPAGLRLAEIMATLYRPEPEVAELTELLSQDPELSLNLLRIVNSPLYRSHGSISSIREVILRLGLVRLRHWVTMLSALQTVATEQARVVLVRAYFCEALSERIRVHPPSPDKAFLVGLLSGVDTLLHVPVGEFIGSMSLEHDVQKAVLQRKGALGRLLRLAMTVERAVAMGQDLERLDAALLKLYQQSANRVQSLIRVLNAPG